VSYLKARNVKQEHTVHRHADGTEHVHGDESAIDGLYVTHLSFSRAGDWGVELLMKKANESVEKLGFAVTVLKAPLTPAIGSPAPPSRNLIASDVKDLREIDSSP
jgi:hypothetical protein